MTKRRLTENERIARNQAICHAYDNGTPGDILADEYNLARQTITWIVMNTLRKPPPRSLLHKLGEDYAKWKLAKMEKADARKRKKKVQIVL